MKERVGLEVVGSNIEVIVFEKIYREIEWGIWVIGDKKMIVI